MCVHVPTWTHAAQSGLCQAQAGQGTREVLWTTRLPKGSKDRQLCGEETQQKAQQRQTIWRWSHQQEWVGPRVEKRSQVFTWWAVLLVILSGQIVKVGLGRFFILPMNSSLHFLWNILLNCIFSSFNSFQESPNGPHVGQRTHVCVSDHSLVNLLQILRHWSFHQDNQQQPPVQTGERDSNLWNPPVQPNDEGTTQTLYV